MLNVIVVGLGPIGLNAAKAVQASRGMKLVGLVDVDPNKIGKRLEGLPRIVGKIADTLNKKPAVAIVATASHFDRIAPTLRECIKHKLHVVSSCEEMSFPSFRNKALAARIDSEAKKRKVALLGTGVNPGFV